MYADPIGIENLKFSEQFFVQDDGTIVFLAATFEKVKNAEQFISEKAKKNEQMQEKKRKQVNKIQDENQYEEIGQNERDAAKHKRKKLLLD